ncbi:Homeobox protein onecut [Nymphon striatum]|nr:Homeobox protein onecut [Nymphon striatum]
MAYFDNETTKKKKAAALLLLMHLREHDEQLLQPCSNRVAFVCPAEYFGYNWVNGLHMKPQERVVYNSSLQVLKDREKSRRTNFQHEAGRRYRINIFYIFSGLKVPTDNFTKDHRKKWNKSFNAVKIVQVNPGEQYQTGINYFNMKWSKCSSHKKGGIYVESMSYACWEEQQVPVEHTPAPKKPRLVFTDLQRRTLQAIFKETKRPSKEMQQTISLQLGLELATVSNFFMNARRRSQDKWLDDGSSTSSASSTSNKWRMFIGYIIHKTGGQNQKKTSPRIYIPKNFVHASPPKRLLEKGVASLERNFLIVRFLLQLHFPKAFHIRHQHLWAGDVVRALHNLMAQVNKIKINRVIDNHHEYNLLMCLLSILKILFTQGAAGSLTDSSDNRLRSYHSGFSVRVYSFSLCLVKDSRKAARLLLHSWGIINYQVQFIFGYGYKGQSLNETSNTTEGNLKKREGIVITKPDKGSGVVIINEQRPVLTFAQSSICRGRKNCVPIDHHCLRRKGKDSQMLPSFVGKGKDLTNKVNNMFPKSIADPHFPKGSRLSHLYALPKTDKSKLSMRPILSASRKYNPSRKMVGREAQTTLGQRILRKLHFKLL